MLGKDKGGVMSVKVVRESHDAMMPYEHCAVCGKPTPHWVDTADISKNVALCTVCAAKIDADDVPTREEWFRAFGHKD